MSMTKQLVVAALMTAGLSTPVSAGVAGFAIVNQTGGTVSGLALRRAGTTEWTSIRGGASDGASTSIAFSDPDCAFDLRAAVSGHGETVWSRINLCEVKSVTLHRDASGTSWVDYD